MGDFRKDMSRRMGKTNNLYRRKQAQISFAVTAPKLFVFQRTCSYDNVSVISFVALLLAVSIQSSQLCILHARGSGARLYDKHDIKLFILVGWGRSFLFVAWPTGVRLIFFLLLRISVSYSATRDLHRRATY